jgi:hypothetical protein
MKSLSRLLVVLAILAPALLVATHAEAAGKYKCQVFAVVKFVARDADTNKHDYLTSFPTKDNKRITEIPVDTIEECVEWAKKQLDAWNSRDKARSLIASDFAGWMNAADYNKYVGLNTTEAGDSTRKDGMFKPRKRLTVEFQGEMKWQIVPEWIR